MKEESYDFLRDLVKNEEENIESGDAPKPKRKRLIYKTILIFKINRVIHNLVILRNRVV